MRVVAWAIFDSQGFYETRETEVEAQEFCNHYNERDFKAYGARPYSCKPLIVAPSAGEVQLWYRASQNIKAFFGESAK